MIIVYIIVGVALGSIFMFLFMKKETDRLKTERELQKTEYEKNAALQFHDAELQSALLKQKNERLELDFNNQLTHIKSQDDTIFQSQKTISTLEADCKAFNLKLNEQKEEVETLHKKLNTEFENIASKILKQNTTEFNDIHKKGITELLTPFKEKITDFEKKVADTYDKELRERMDLKNELKNLHELNKRISDEANNLTKALKGDNKKQGNWGEVILERVLERSGLVKGREYETQFSTHNVDDKKIQPDVVVFLPDKKHIIIDAKVSLIAYERFVNATDDDDKQLLIKEHLTSVKSHISILSDKKYHTSDELISPEFVLLFMPIESSFSIALQYDNELFAYAWDKKIIIVSPTTLLATLRTIESIWKQEYQTKNALEIARQGGALYDKLVGFVADLEKIGKSIDTLSGVHDDAMKKLHSGTGNLINRAETIRKLGAKTNKTLPEKFLENDNDLFLLE